MRLRKFYNLLRLSSSSRIASTLALSFVSDFAVLQRD
jgi:hypothetical protein